MTITNGTETRELKYKKAEELSVKEEEERAREKLIEAERMAEELRAKEEKREQEKHMMAKEERKKEREKQIEAENKAEELRVKEAREQEKQRETERIVGDLRAKNFLIDEYGILKISDFKHARALSSCVTESASLGIILF